MAQAVAGTAPQRLDWQAISNIMNGFAQRGHRPRSRLRCFSLSLCMHACMHVYLHTLVSAASLSVCMYACMHECVYACMRACIHTLYAYTQTDTHTGRVCAGWRQARCGRTWKPPLSLCLQCPANNRVVCNKRLPNPQRLCRDGQYVFAMHTQTRTHTHTQTHARTQTHTYTYIHTYIHIYIQAYKHSHIHTNIHTCIHRLPTS